MKQAISMVGSLTAVFLFSLALAFTMSGDRLNAIGCLSAGLILAVLAIGLSSEPRRESQLRVLSRW